jgi:tetratricopeptide (TPR) repeat protein
LPATTLYAALGDSKQGLGQSKEAIGDFSAAIALEQRLEKSSYFSLQGRSRSYAQIGDIGRAIQDLTAAISNPPDMIPLDADLFVKRGRLYLANRDLKRALSDFEQVIESDTAAPDVMAEAYRARAEYHELTGNVHEAGSDRTSAEEILRTEEEAESGYDE